MIDRRPVAPIILAHGRTQKFDGLTIREHFAGLAMQSIITASLARHEGRTHYLNPPAVSSLAFEVADAMIEASRK